MVFAEKLPPFATFFLSAKTLFIMYLNDFSQSLPKPQIDRTVYLSRLMDYGCVAAFINRAVQIKSYGSKI